jgi:hypothetical protein
MASFVAFLDRQGATSLIVHGRGPRGSERWDHDQIAGFQGWEVMDISEYARARLKSPWNLYHLITLLAGWPVGLADEAFLHMMREGFDTPAVAAYDSLNAIRPLTATAGLNAHPKLKLGSALFPSYDPFFRTMVTHVTLQRSLVAGSDQVAHDGRVLREGIEAGNAFISLGRAREARGFRFGVRVGNGSALPMGGKGVGGPAAVLRAGFQDGPKGKIVYRIFRNGEEEGWVLGPGLQWPVAGPGVYRVEVYTFGARAGNTFFRLKPWIFANPVRVIESVADAIEGAERQNAAAALSESMTGSGP